MNRKQLIAECESRLRQNPEDNKMRLNLILLRYGVVMVSDEPLLGRIDEQDIINDFDYRQLIKTADDEEKMKIRTLISRIYDEQEEVRKVRNSTKPFDVYLAFDTSAQEDTELALEIRNGLNSEGITVYYEPEIPKDRLPDAYRLYALSTAKLMILLSTAKEHLEKPEITGAWKRYLNMMEEESSRHLLPAYKGMKPEDFPENISKIQGVDLGRIGAVETVLLPRARELTGKEAQIFVVSSETGQKINLTNILDRIELHIEDGRFDVAEKQLRAIESEYGTDYPKAHYLHLLIRYKASGLNDLILKTDQTILSDPDYQYVLDHGSGEVRNSLSNIEALHRDAVINERDAKFVKEIAKAHTDGKYTEILKLADQISSMEGFTRWGDVQGFIDAAKGRVENQRLHDEYVKLIGDGKDFFKKQFAKKYPDKYKEYFDNLGVTTIEDLMNIETMSFIIVGVLLAFCILINTDANENLMMILELLNIGLGFWRRFKENGSLIPDLLYAFGLYFLLPAAVYAVIFVVGSKLGFDDLLRTLLSYVFRFTRGYKGGIDRQAVEMCTYTALASVITLLQTAEEAVPEIRGFLNASKNNKVIDEYQKKIIPEFEEQEY
ncbi:MAG TPA: hypothetical protein DHW39_01345, partial [Erysipelotrichaceae bacterium]|nr:hypothetical protein [Erysipelotrichaceae bacterium]